MAHNTRKCWLWRDSIVSFFDERGERKIMEKNKKTRYMGNCDEKEKISEEMKMQIEEEIKKMEDQAFMDGYEYAIQILIDGKNKNRR